MLLSRRGYKWNDVLSPNWWAYNITGGGGGGGLITGILRYPICFAPVPVQCFKVAIISP